MPLLLILFLLVARSASADEWIIPAVGRTAGANGTDWRSDVRIFNPGAVRISIEATLIQNGRAGVKTIELKAGETAIIDDAMSTLFERNGIGAIELRSPSAFDVSSRTYTAGSCGTYGQFVPAVPATAALQRGLILQIAQNARSRTNAGFVNARDAATAVTLYLYDQSGGLMASSTSTLPPWGAVQIALSSFAPGGIDAGVLRYEADQAVIGYASVIDNASGDAVFIPAANDRGGQQKIFEIVAQQFRFTVTPGGFETIRVRTGDRVTLRVRSIDTLHGFNMPGFIPHLSLTGNGEVIERSFTVSAPGTYPFYCTIECGSGHHGMAGQMVVIP